MIKKLLSAALFVCAIGTQAQQVQNPGFETWASNFPTGWGTFGQLLVGLGQPNPGTETQSTTKHSGSFAIKLANQNVAIAGGIIPGVANTGPITLSGGGSPTLGYQAFAGQPVSFDFWYEYAPGGTGDTAFAQAILTKWNTGTNKRDTLAYGGVLLTTQAAYTHVTVPFNWLTATNSDSIQLTFASSTLASPPAGTAMYVDDVNMTSSIGIQSLNANGTFGEVYPNPATSTITFSTNDEKAKYAKVFDLTGRAVTTIELTGKITKTDVSSFENGMYIYVITDANGNKIGTSKFNVAK